MGGTAEGYGNLQSKMGAAMALGAFCEDGEVDRAS